jgi:hypothetical protein
LSDESDTHSNKDLDSSDSESSEEEEDKKKNELGSNEKGEDEKDEELGADGINRRCTVPTPGLER